VTSAGPTKCGSSRADGSGAACLEGQWFRVEVVLEEQNWLHISAACPMGKEGILNLAAALS
jgi:hypothetical protein